MSVIVACVFTFFLTVAGVAVGIIMARRYGFLDHPDARKDHDGAVPPIGGLIIFPVFMGSLLIFKGELSVQTLSFFAALLVLLITGAVDDKRHVRALPKFLLHMLAAFLIVVPGFARVYYLDNLFGLGDIGLGLMAIPFSFIATVLLINAINLLDGLDGLAGGIGFIAIGFICFALGGDMELSILLAALAGFLCFNMRAPWLKQAAVFLGDSGSMALGLTLAWYSINLAGMKGAEIHPMSIAWILALPIYDICGQFARRMREGRHPFSPDKNHFHHHVLQTGMAPNKATIFILMICIVFGIIGVFGIRIVPVPVLTIMWITGLLVHIYLSMRPELYKSILRWCLARA